MIRNQNIYMYMYNMVAIFAASRPGDPHHYSPSVRSETIPRISGPEPVLYSETILRFVNIIGITGKSKS